MEKAPLIEYGAPIDPEVMVAPPDVTVYPGHGPATTVGAEKRTNPFFR